MCKLRMRMKRRCLRRRERGKRRKRCQRCQKRRRREVSKKC